MQLIAADIGNSSTKIGVPNNADDRSANKGPWTCQIRLENDQPIILTGGEFSLPQQPSTWAVSSVNSVRTQELSSWVKKHRPDDRFHLISESDVDLDSNIQSRSQLGRDRLIAAWMAVQLANNVGPLIVVDAGTAVTVDLVDEQLVFQGGTIFPGADTNFQQLAQNTDALPSLSRNLRSQLLKEMDADPVGKSTEQAIFNGVYQSQIGGIVGIVEAISKKLSEPPAVYATGGGVDDISKFLPESWIRVPDLVLRGAIEIGRKLI